MVISEEIILKARHFPVMGYKACKKGGFDCGYLSIPCRHSEVRTNRSMGRYPIVS